MCRRPLNLPTTNGMRWLRATLMFYARVNYISLYSLLSLLNLINLWNIIFLAAESFIKNVCLPLQILLWKNFQRQDRHKEQSYK